MFRGSIPALVTPFRSGGIDKEAFQSLIERQIENGSSAVVPVGTTGETSTLSHEEHEAVVSLCVDMVAGRVPVIAGAGSNATSEAIEFAAHAKRVGADAALIVCPYYNKPNQEGLFAHFKAVNDSVALPLIVYNVPGRTASDLMPETLADLSSLPNIIGIKDATGDVSRLERHRALIEDSNFTYLSGDDPSAVAFHEAGGHGCISVTANVAPLQVAGVQDAAATGDYSTARERDDRLSQLHSALFDSPSPGPTKYALSQLGLCTPDLRLPLTPPDEGVRRSIDAAMGRAGVKG